MAVETGQVLIRGTYRAWDDGNRENLCRAFQYRLAAPEAISSQVPGSGTSVPPPPLEVAHGSADFFFFFESSESGTVAAPVECLGFFCMPIPQTPGKVAGKTGVTEPLAIGSRVLSGIVGPSPGLRLIRADWNGTGGVAKAVPACGKAGSSNLSAGGSDSEVAC